MRVTPPAALAVAVLAMAACSSPAAPAGIAPSISPTIVADTGAAQPSPSQPTVASPSASPGDVQDPVATVTDVAGRVAYTHPADWIDGPESEGVNYIRHGWNTPEGTYVEITGFSGDPTLAPSVTVDAYVDATFGTATTARPGQSVDFQTSVAGDPASLTRFVIDYNDDGPVDIFCVGAVAGDGFGFLYVEQSGDDAFLCDDAQDVLRSAGRG